ncbi:MAG: efflux RND transporter periplasmic adaptor subunit [Gemmatimonadota bacterium]|nr:efflux RND transporter periplasmic adaptor subunit [Gemmatimonadota bacterium]
MSDNLEEPPRNEPRSKRRRLLPLGIVLLGVIAMAGLVVTRPEPVRAPAVRTLPAVSTMPLFAREGSLSVEGSGTVRPVAEISLAPQVGGRVVRLSPALARGGVFQAGDPLLEIDPESYRNAVAIARADVAQREVEVALARQEQVIAQEEYRMLRARVGGEEVADTTLSGRLAMRQPQVDAAEAALARAEAQLADAQLALGRTIVTAPFTGRVRSESVDVGQYVAPGQAIAELYATDEVEVVISLSTRQLVLLDDLWSETATRRIPATVHAEFGGTWHDWDGYVDRASGALDETTRTIEVVVRVPRAFDGEGRPPLLIGSYVRASLEGRRLERYFAVPRPALREGSVVWVISKDDILRSAPVQVVQEVQDTVFVTGDLPEGAEVVVAAPAVVTEGMEVDASITLPADNTPAGSGDRSQ